METIRRHNSEISSQFEAPREEPQGQIDLLPDAENEKIKTVFCMKNDSPIPTAMPEKEQNFPRSSKREARKLPLEEIPYGEKIPHGKKIPCEEEIEQESMGEIHNAEGNEQGYGMEILGRKEINSETITEIPNANDIQQFSLKNDSTFFTVALEEEQSCPRLSKRDESKNSLTEIPCEEKNSFGEEIKQGSIDEILNAEDVYGGEILDIKEMNQETIKEIPNAEEIQQFPIKSDSTLPTITPMKKQSFPRLSKREERMRQREKSRGDFFPDTVFVENKDTVLLIQKEEKELYLGGNEDIPKTEEFALESTEQIFNTEEMELGAIEEIPSTYGILSIEGIPYMEGIEPGTMEEKNAYYEEITSEEEILYEENKPYYEEITSEEEIPYKEEIPYVEGNEQGRSWEILDTKEINQETIADIPNTEEVHHGSFEESLNTERNELMVMEEEKFDLYDTNEIPNKECFEQGSMQESLSVNEIQYEVAIEIPTKEKIENEPIEEISHWKENETETKKRFVDKEEIPIMERIDPNSPKNGPNGDFLGKAQNFNRPESLKSLKLIHSEIQSCLYIY